MDDDRTFLNGSVWLRADFHLHTKADKEFSFSGEDSEFVSCYVAALKEANVRIGVIANHNKFDLDEFKALRKNAQKHEIFLLPGVELSVDDGHNGIHTIVVFSRKWLEGGQDYINPFLNVAFQGRNPTEYQDANGRTSLGLRDTIKKLEGFSRDFFLVFAHVEDRSGLWEAVGGGRFEEFGSDRLFQRNTLAFQKVRTRDLRQKVTGWLGDWYPAEVEGSDCKDLDQIGRGEPCYLKIGDFNFEAVKYALLDHHTRVSSEPPMQSQSHIRSVSFEGGVIDGKTIRFSPELNTLIGIRGSGKSSILESVRYALGIPLGEGLPDEVYRQRLVDHTLGSGGKVTIRAVDVRGQQYEVRRILNDQPDVYIDGKIQPGISIRETILRKPIYFGQKDLCSSGEGFEKDLVEKLVGENLRNIRERIEAQRQKMAETITRLKALSKTGEKKRDYASKKKDAEHRLKFYREHGVEEKLQRQIDFDADSRKCSQVVRSVETYLEGLAEFVGSYEDELKNQRTYESRQNEPFFKEFLETYDKLLASFERIKAELSQGKQTYADLCARQQEFEKRKEGFKEEFAKIERKLAEELKDSGAKAIRPDEFRQLRTTVDQAKQMLGALQKQESRQGLLRNELHGELAALNDLWLEEFRAIQSELDKVNRNHSSLEIKAEFKGDKNAFLAYMKDVFRGSRIRETTFASLIDEFPDFGAMRKDFARAKGVVGNSAQVFSEYFTDNAVALMTWQVPNHFTIEYRGKELKHHSLGQRASALILFVLSQGENDVFIIDQPEDDLDNQTVYEDVIKLVRKLKPHTQFIFATHNANFPVLGDAERVISCEYTDNTITPTGGSIDCPEVQGKIVAIMEGGEEAFRQRKRRYESWNPQNS